MVLVLGDHKPRSLPPSASILEVYIEALPGFSHRYGPQVSTTHCSLKAASLIVALAVGMVGRIPRTGRE